MTCIVGIVDGGGVVLGGDSAGVDTSSLALSIRSDPKVFRAGEFLMGFTTSFRMGQLLAHAFSPPELRVGQDVYAFMVRDFVPSVRQCFEAGGWAQVRDGQHAGGEFLVGFAGRLFCVHSDFQVAEHATGFFAVGCGAEIARGVLWATAGQPAEARAKLALTAAAEMSGGVRPPFVIERVSP